YEETNRCYAGFEHIVAGGVCKLAPFPDCVKVSGFRLGACQCGRHGTRILHHRHVDWRAVGRSGVHTSPEGFRAAEVRLPNPTLERTRASRVGLAEFVSL